MNKLDMIRLHSTSVADSREDENKPLVYCAPDQKTNVYKFKVSKWRHCKLEDKLKAAHFLLMHLG